MTQLYRLKRLKDEIYRIARRHRAERVWVFGSCARGEEAPGSDVDFIADFQEHATIFDLGGLEYDLAQFLGVNVDVVASNAVMDDAFAANVKRDKVLL